MAVETLTEFPSSFIAGDTIRVTLGNSDFPSTLWTMKVLLQSPTAKKSFSASAVGGGSTDYTLVITAADSAKLVPGLYVVSFTYTEISSSERKTDEDNLSVTVYADPEGSLGKSVARQTLEAMQAAFLKMSKGQNLSVNFNGQSFTKRNLKDFQDAIDRQQAIVNGEDAARTGHRRIARILHPL